MNDKNTPHGLPLAVLASLLATRHTPEASAPPVIAEVPTPPAAPEEDAAGEAPVVAEAAPPATDAPAIAEPDATPDVPASVEPPEVTDAPAAPMPPEDETSDGGVEIASAEQAPATEPVPPDPAALKAFHRASRSGGATLEVASISDLGSLVDS